MSKKKKNIINQDKAVLDFKSMGFGAGKMNFYQIRIRIAPDVQGLYDWYHTTGSLVRDMGYTHRIAGAFFTPEAVVKAINNYEK